MKGTWARRAVVCALALAIAAPVLAPVTADATVVICQRKNRLKLRVDTCKGKETQVDAVELGVTGPQGPQGPQGAQGAPGDEGPQGPSNLLATAHVGGDGTLLSAWAQPGITVSSAKDGCPGCYRIELAGTGAFAGMTGSDLIVQATAQSDIWGVANAFGDGTELTDDLAVIYTYTWVSSTTGGGGDTDNNVYVVVYRGTPPPVAP